MNNTGFQHSLRDYGTPAFRNSIKAELKAMPTGNLPLDKAVIHGGYVDDHNLEAMILSTTESEQFIQVKIGVFFTEIIINCGCGDDPMPVDAYCEMLMMINKLTAEAEFELINEA